MFAYAERMFGERPLQTLAIVGWGVAVIVEAVWQGLLEGAAGEESVAGVAKAALALGIAVGILCREARSAAVLAASVSAVWVTAYVVAYRQAFGPDFLGDELYLFVWFFLMIIALPLMVAGSTFGRALRLGVGAVARPRR